MKLNSLNLGKPLTREEQKKISGGRVCPSDTYVFCYCTDGYTEAFQGDGFTDNYAVCFYAVDVCEYHQGVAGYDPYCEYI